MKEEETQKVNTCGSPISNSTFEAIQSRGNEKRAFLLDRDGADEVKYHL